MWEGGGWAGWSGVEGGKWDNCNSIINKYIKNTHTHTHKRSHNILSKNHWGYLWCIPSVLQFLSKVRNLYLNLEGNLDPRV